MVKIKDPFPEGFTKKESSDLTNVPQRLVQFYTEEQVIIPKIDNPQGRGSVRRYSLENLMEFMIISELIKFGATISYIRKFFKKIRSSVIDLNQHAKPYMNLKSTDRKGSEPHTCLVVFNTHDQEIGIKSAVHKQGRLSIYMEGNPSALVIDLTEIGDKLMEKLNLQSPEVKTERI